MKILLISTLLLSFNLGATTGRATSAIDEQVNVEEMNPSPNPTPEFQENEKFDKTLSVGERENQEERKPSKAGKAKNDVLDYSTSPQDNR